MRKATQAWMPASSVLVVSTEAPMLPVVWAVPMFWTQATLAPAATAEWAADRPDSPAPTTTMSYSRVSAKSVMGSGACRNAGSPASAEPVSASEAVSAAVFGAQPARALAPTTPAAASPVNLNRSRRVTSMVTLLNTCGLFEPRSLCARRAEPSSSALRDRRALLTGHIMAWGTKSRIGPIDEIGLNR